MINSEEHIKELLEAKVLEYNTLDFIPNSWVENKLTKSKKKSNQLEEMYQYSFLPKKKLAN